jgi:hypothetical protein
LARGDPLADRQQHAVALDHLAVVRVVDGRELDPFAPDVLPDVQLGPVRQREGPQVFARAHAALVELPELGTLTLGVPLPEGVTERQDALLGPGLVLVPAGAAEGSVELVGVDGVEQGRGLQAIARRDGARVGHPALVDGVLDLGDEETRPLCLDLRIAVGEHLGEVVAGVDMEDGEGDPSRLERLGGQVEQDRRVLASAEEQDRALRLGGHLAYDEDGE